MISRHVISIKVAVICCFVVAHCRLFYNWSVFYLFYSFCAVPCPRFCVSLVCGPQPERDDIAFQLTAHFDTEWLIRNSKLAKEWGAEEGASTRKFPFERERPFIIEIFTSPSAYLVSQSVAVPYTMGLSHNWLALSSVSSWMNR